MIGSLTGTLRAVGEDAVLLEVGGVGYEIAVLPSLRTEATVGASVTLRTHLHVREDSLALYGFTEQYELSFFLMLIDVPGVGPRSAMSILAAAPPEMLARAVRSGEVGVLTKVSGIGRKTAERIVTELRSRLEREYPADAEEGSMPHGDVVEALIALGFARSQAREAARTVPKDIASLEEALRLALQHAGQNIRAHR